MPRSPLGIALGTANFHRTANSGTTWVVASNPAPVPANPDVHAVTPARAYAFATLRRLYKSVDGGLTWTLLGNPAPTTRELTSIRVLPSGRIIVGHVAGGAAMAISYTDDEAATWTGPVTVDAAIKDVRGLSIWSLSPNIVLLLSPSAFNAIFRSADGGATWANVQNAPNNRFACLYVDPETDYCFTVEVNPAPALTRILRSINKGLTWTQVFTAAVDAGGTTYAARSYFARAMDGRLLFIGGGVGAIARQSTDNGASWVAYAGVPPAGGNNGIYRSQNALHAMIQTIRWNISTDGNTWSNPASQPTGGAGVQGFDSPILPASRSKAKKYGGFGSPFVPVSS